MRTAHLLRATQHQAHEHRTRLRDWLGRKAFYGTSAAPLSVRHPDKTAPVVISASSLLVWLPMSMGSMTGYLASLLVAGFSTRRVARTMRNTEANHRDVALLALRGIGAAALQLSAAICRHYWPVALAGALISRRCRQAVLLAAVTTAPLRERMQQKPRRVPQLLEIAEDPVPLPTPRTNQPSPVQVPLRTFAPAE